MLKPHLCVHQSILIVCFSVPTKKGFECTLSVRGCVHKYFCTFYLFKRLSLRAGLAFANQCMHESWSRIPSGHKIDFFYSNRPGNPRQAVAPYLYMRIQNTTYTEIMHLL